MAGLKRKVPADISPELREKIRTLAVDAFKHLGCAGVSRIDFMIDDEDGSLYINEFNTIPGSLAFYLWKPVGVSYTELLDKIINIALKRNRNESEITYSFDSNILSMGSARGTKGSKGAKA
jgi:D-alanine-D-alanine ligase